AAERIHSRICLLHGGCLSLEDDQPRRADLRWQHVLHRPILPGLSRGTARVGGSASPCEPQVGDDERKPPRPSWIAAACALRSGGERQRPGEQVTCISPPGSKFPSGLATMASQRTCVGASSMSSKE